MTFQREGFRIPEDLLLPWNQRKNISLSHAAFLMKCSTTVVRNLIEEGKILGYKVRDLPNSPYRINYDSVVEYMRLRHTKYGLEPRF